MIKFLDLKKLTRDSELKLIIESMLFLIKAGIYRESRTQCSVQILLNSVVLNML